MALIVGHSAYSEVKNVTTIAITIKRDGNLYRAELKASPTEQPLFESRANNRASAAKRDAERLLGPLDWKPASAFGLRDPDILQVTELGLD